MAAISSMKIKGLFKQEFDGFSGTDMTFNFTSNLNVIIGPNGAGKTTVIRLTNEVFGPMEIDEGDVPAFIFFDKISSSDIIWMTPFSSIEFNLVHVHGLEELFGNELGELTVGKIIIQKHMAGTQPQQSDYLEFGDGEGTSIRIFGPAHEESMNANDYDRAIEIYNKLISQVTMHMVPVNRMVRIEESAFEDSRMLALMGDDEISSLFLDGKGVTLDVIPEVCRKWVTEANECWRNELIGLGSTMLRGLDAGWMNTHLPGQLAPIDITTAHDNISPNSIAEAVALRSRVETYEGLGVYIRGWNDLGDDPGVETWTAVDWLYNLAGDMSEDSTETSKQLHSVAIRHMKNSMDRLDIKVRKLLVLKLFINKFFDGKHCKFSLDDGLTIRLNNYHPSYGAPANSTDILPLQYLSSGEKHALIMMMTVLQGNKDSMIMIDEPETSLHIEWQENLLPWLMEGARSVGSNLLITTHSPHLLNDHECNILKIPIREENEESESGYMLQKCSQCGSILTIVRRGGYYNCSVCGHGGSDVDFFDISHLEPPEVAPEPVDESENPKDDD